MAFDFIFNGLAGLGRILSDAQFFAPYTKALTLSRGTGVTTHTRATTQTFSDHEGILRTAPSGVVAVEGGRMVRNLLTDTADASAASWSKGTVTVSGETITATAGAGNHWTYHSFTPVTGNKFVGQVKAKAGTAGWIALGWGLNATTEGVFFNVSTGAKGTTNGTISGDITGPDSEGYYICSITKTTPTGNLSVEIHTADNQALTFNAAGTETVLVKELQTEDVTGQSIQTAGEYVSVGVLSDPWHGAGADGVKFFDTDISGNPIAASTLDGIEIWGAATNLALQSNAFGTAPWADSGTPSATQNVLGPDGATSAWTLTDSDGGNAEGVNQAITLTAAAYTMSVFVKKTAGVQATYPVLQIITGSVIAQTSIDTTNGIATVWTAYTGLTMLADASASCVSYNNDYWRVSLTATGTAASYSFRLWPAVVSNPVQSTGTNDGTLQGSAVFYGAMVNLGAYAGPYVATTTAAVARNAGILSTPTASNILAATGTIAFEFTPGHAPSGTVYLWGSYVDANNGTFLLHDATNLIFRKRIAGVNTDATIALAFVSGTTYNGAFAWGADGQKIAVDGTLGTPHANTTAAQIAATMQLGSDGNGANQAGMAVKMNYILQRQASDSELVAMTA